MSDAQIFARNERRLHERLATHRGRDAATAGRSDLIDRDGTPLASSSLQCGAERREFHRSRLFQGAGRRDAGTYVSGIARAAPDRRCHPISSTCRGGWRRQTARSTASSLSRCSRDISRTSTHDRQSPGDFYALVRSRRMRFSRAIPAPRLCARVNSARSSMLRAAIDRGVDRTAYSRSIRRDRRHSTGGSASASSPAFRSMCSPASEKLGDRRRMAVGMMATHLVFGLPATLLLFVDAVGGAAPHPSACMTRPNAANWRKTRCGRRSGSKRSVN